MKQLTILEEIIDLARWAPSGDNTQPWRFEILNEQHLRVHGFDTREDCVYDFRGHPSQIALGALLENLSLAAGKFNLEACLSLGSDSHDEHLVFDVLFSTRKSGVLLII
ncbi:UBA/THIF-type NAD/FAD binding fold protein, partial [mine drainage metagenome]